MENIRFKLLVLITAGSMSLFGQNTSLSSSIKNGQLVYTGFCMSCHMEDGNGLESVYPSLVKSENLHDKNRLVKIILQGMRGPIVVKGQSFNGEMASISLTNKEVADVLNYIRNSWGNKAPEIKLSEIEPAKKAMVKNYQPY